VRVEGALNLHVVVGEHGLRVGVRREVGLVHEHVHGLQLLLVLHHLHLLLLVELLQEVSLLLVGYLHPRNPQRWSHGASGSEVGVVV